MNDIDELSTVLLRIAEERKSIQEALKRADEAVAEALCMVEKIKLELNRQADSISWFRNAGVFKQQAE